jgi:hypothetical protein
LTAIGLVPGGSVTKKWTYIARKQNKQKFYEKAACTSHKKNSTSHRISQYNTSTMNRIRVTEHRKTTEHKIHFTYS